VIQSAILIGLYARQTVAWVTARWLTAIGAVIMSILFLFAAIGGGTKLWILAVVASEVALAWLFFGCLAELIRKRISMRRERSNQTIQRTAGSLGFSLSMKLHPHPAAARHPAS